MQLLKILCLLFLSMISYDVISYLLLNKNEIELSSKPGGDKINNAFDSVGSKLGAASKWIVGSGCLMCLFLLRLLFRRPVLKLHDMSGDITRGSPGKELDKKSRRESFLTCRISNTTLDTYTDDQTYDFPGQLSPEQLQVLLEELKFRTDEKFDGIDEWIEANEQDSKLCIKRLERIETELSYIRHQIFILMNNSSQIGSSLCIGEPHDTKEHVEALKDLSKILAQVKKQFQDDQYKVEIKESGDHEEDKVRGTVDQDANDDNVGPGGDEQNLSEQDHSDVDINDERVKDQMKKDVTFIETSQTCNEEEVEKKYCQNQNVKMNDSDERKLSGSGTRESSVLKSDLNEQNLKDEELQESIRKFEGSSINENKCASPRETRIIPSSVPFSNEQAELFSTRVNSKTVNSDEKDTTLINKKMTNSKQYLSNESPSINLIDQTNYNQIQDDQIETGNEKEIGSPKNLPPNKRTVRFANDNRDESPLTHLENKRESSPTKQTDGKDSKMGACHGVDINRNRRESASCPLVEDKRQSRRNILERELSNLERRVSPSPIRQRFTRRNVRSKVADYIRGSK